MFMQNTSRLLAKTAPPNAVIVTGHEAKQRPGVAKAAFPGGFLPTRSFPSTTTLVRSSFLQLR